MKLEKIMEIRNKCSQCQNSLEVEKAHPEWCNCRTCPLGGRVQIEISDFSSQTGLDGVILTISPCLLLGEIISKVKVRRKKRKKK